MIATDRDRFSPVSSLWPCFTSIVSVAVATSTDALPTFSRSALMYATKMGILLSLAATGERGWRYACWAAAMSGTLQQSSVKRKSLQRWLSQKQFCVRTLQDGTNWTAC